MLLQGTRTKDRHTRCWSMHRWPCSPMDCWPPSTSCATARRSPSAHLWLPSCRSVTDLLTHHMVESVAPGRGRRCFHVGQCSTNGDVRFRVPLLGAKQRPTTVNARSLGRMTFRAMQAIYSSRLMQVGLKGMYWVCRKLWRGRCG